MSSPTLPLELENIILNLLKDDHQTLKACSLVCRSFLITSQKHLFSKIVLQRDPTKPIYPALTTRLRRVLFSSPHIASFIKSLDIIDNWAVRIPEGEERVRLFLTRSDRSENWVSCDTDLTYILESIKNITCIAFSSAGRGTAWHSLPMEMQDAIRSIFTSHRLIRVVLKHTDQFPLSLFSTCSALRHLELFGVGFDTPGPGGDTWTGEKIYLVSLQMSGLSSFLDVITNYILSSRCRLDISRLKTLAIASDGKDEVQLLNWKLIYQSASSLEHLVFDALLPVMTDLYAPSFEQAFDIIDLGQLPFLHSLVIRFRISDDNDLERRVFLLSHILGKIGRRNVLQRVTILCIVVAEGPVMHPPEAWSMLDRVLSRSEMACLQEVIFRISNDQIQAIDAVKKGLPKLWEKKKLTLIH